MRVAKVNAGELRPLPQNIVHSLNTRRKGSLLGALADVMRVASQTGLLLSRKGRQHVVTRKQLRRLKQSAGRHVLSAIPRDALAPLLDKIRALNEKLASQRISISALPTSTKPIRLFWWPQTTDGEMQTVFNIINASDAGALDRLKACDHCQTFFIARRDVDRFCPGKRCRKDHDNKTPEGRKRNAEYQRKYRKSQKALEEGSVKRARRVRPL